QRRLAFGHGAIKLVDHLRARDPGLRQPLEALLAVAVDHHYGWRWAQVRFFAGHDKHAEVLVRARLRLPEFRAAVVTGFLDGEFVLAVGQGLPGQPISLRILLLAHLADPAHELVGIEMGVAAVDEGGDDAVVEIQQARVRALGGPRHVPEAGVGPNTAHLAAREQAHDVDLVRRLVEHHAAAGAGAELLGPPRAVEKVGEVERGDHANRAIGSSFDNLFRLQNRGIKAVAVADDELHAVVARRVVHGAAIFERKGHRLLDQHVLLRRAREPRLAGVELVRRGYVDHLYGRVGAQRFHGGENTSSVFLLEAPAS